MNGEREEASDNKNEESGDWQPGSGFWRPGDCESENGKMVGFHAGRNERNKGVVFPFVSFVVN